jgi:Tol biopolymer transport system component
VRRFLVSLLSFALAIVLAIPASAAPARTRLISKTSGGDPANDDSNVASITPSGRYVVFESFAQNLPGEDLYQDVYIHDRRTGTTRLISRTSAGDPASDGDSSDPSVSGTGRYVGFESEATDLPGANGFVQIYIHDRQTGKTRLVSKNNAGDASDAECDDAAISLSGRFIAFQCLGENLPGDDAYEDVYLHDRGTGRTRLVSRTSGGDPADGDSYDPAISGNGRFITFETIAPAFGSDTSDDQIVVHDRDTGRSRTVSRTSGGVLADGDTDDPNISIDGRFVVFNTTAQNLGSDGTYDQIVIHDRQTRKTRLVSRTSGGEMADGGDSEDPAVSGAGGRYVAFESTATNLPENNGYVQIYVRDRLRGRTRIISVDNQGFPANDECSDCLHRGQRVMSGDGSFVVFDTSATNLPGQDLYEDVYVRGPLHR